jgi:hypothetical protein
VRSFRAGHDPVFRAVGNQRRIERGLGMREAGDVPPASVRRVLLAQRSDDASGVRPGAASQSFGGSLGIVDPTLEPILGGLLGGLHLPLGLAAVPPQDPGGTAASVRPAPVRLAEICRSSALQAGDLPPNPGLAPQGFGGVGNLLARRKGGSERGIGNPLRLPAE